MPSVSRSAREPRSHARAASDREGSTRALRWVGLFTLLVTLVGVGLNFAWFARRGLSPGRVLALSWPLWVAVTVAVAAVAGGGWLLGRLLAGQPGGEGSEGGEPPPSRRPPPRA